jgi:hypothetical protein
MPFLQRDLSSGATSLYTMYTPVEDNNGFTEITPTTGKTIYIAPQSGSDSNDGLSPEQPIQSKSRLLQLLQPGDHFRAPCGERFTNWDFNGIPNGIDGTDKTVMYTYNDHVGVRPVFENDGSFLSTSNAAMKNVSFIGLDIYSRYYDPDDEDFTYTTDGSGNISNKISFLRDSENILFEDCILNYVEITMESWAGLFPSELILRRNIFTGAYSFGTTYSGTYRPSNVYIADLTNYLVIEDNVFDSGGWNRLVPGAGANFYNHNLYIQADDSSGDQTNDILLRGNIITRGSGYGAHARPGGKVYDNFFGRNAVQLSLGYNSMQLHDGDNALAEDNCMSETSSYFKGATLADIEAGKDHPGNGLRNGASWALAFYQSVNNPNAQAINNIVSLLDPEYPCIYEFPSLSAIDTDAQLIKTGNIEYKMATPTQGVGPAYPDPERTLGTWHDDNTVLFQELEQSGVIPARVAGYDAFDSAMKIVKSRNRKQWDNRLTANGINNYIRGGFGRAQIAHDKIYA